MASVARRSCAGSESRFQSVIWVVAHMAVLALVYPLRIGAAERETTRDRLIESLRRGPNQRDPYFFQRRERDLDPAGPSSQTGGHTLPSMTTWPSRNPPNAAA